MTRRTMDHAIGQLGAALVLVSAALAVLKLAGVVALPWRLVLAPVWAPLSAGLLMYAVGALFLALAAATSSDETQ